MPDAIVMRINGKEVVVPQGTTVAVAVLLTGGFCRTSISGQRRAPFCGIGICFECRVTINDQRHRLSCQQLCEAGMEIRSDD
jgi:D-hydroxyproline dehydrogenase subunit gamma